MIAMETLDFGGQFLRLVVDDTPDRLALMSALLKDAYKVKVANQGDKGLRITGVGDAAGPDPPRRDGCR